MSGPAPHARAFIKSPSDGETLNVVGDTMRFLADGHDTAGRCSIWIETTPPGNGPPLHRHGLDDEYFYILDGSFTFVLDGATHHVGTGAFVSAPRGSLHTFTNSGDRPGRMLIVTSPAGIEAPFRATHHAATQGPLTPALLGPIFKAFEIEFHGPPLGAPKR